MPKRKASRKSPSAGQGGKRSTPSSPSSPSLNKKTESSSRVLRSSKKKTEPNDSLDSTRKATSGGKKVGEGTSKETKWETPFKYNCKSAPGRVISHLASVFVDKTASSEKLEKLVRIGFSGFCGLKVDRFNRGLVEYLARRYEPSTKSILLPNDVNLPITVDDVHRVYGLPKGLMRIDPSECVESTLPRFAHSLGFTKNKFSNVYIKLVEARLLNESDVNKFCQLFVLYILELILHPSGRYHASFKYGDVLEFVDLIPSFNWCEYVHKGVVDGLEQYVTNTSSRYRTLNGDTYFLMIHYLDNVMFSGEEKRLGEPTCTVWNPKAMKRKLAELTKQGILCISRDNVNVGARRDADGPTESADTFSTPPRDIVSGLPADRKEGRSTADCTLSSDDGMPVLMTESDKALLIPKQTILNPALAVMPTSLNDGTEAENDKSTQKSDPWADVNLNFDQSDIRHEMFYYSSLPTQGSAVDFSNASVIRDESLKRCVDGRVAGSHLQCTVSQSVDSSAIPNANQSQLVPAGPKPSSHAIQPLSQ